jgi:hypothetical protein
VVLVAAEVLTVLLETLEELALVVKVITEDWELTLEVTLVAVVVAVKALSVVLKVEQVLEAREALEQTHSQLGQLLLQQA